MIAPVDKSARILMIALLFLVLLLNYSDRYTIAVLLPAMKIDLHMSDGDLGFVSGTAFSIFYAFMGIPFGRLSDRYSRRWVISAALTLWSAMTMLCGLAQSVLGLVIARILVGVGEAGATPPAHSLISDTYPVQARARALSAISLGLPAGILVSFAVAGYVVQVAGWRAALFAVGLPGFGLALVVFLFLPEPPRFVLDPLNANSGQLPTFRDIAKTLSARRSFVHVCLGSGFYTLVWSGLITWMPSYITRSYGLPIRQAGFELGVAMSLSLFVGLASGGVIADRLSRRDPRYYMWTCVAGSIIPIPFYALALSASGPRISIGFLIPSFMFGILQGAPAIAIVQGVVKSRMRGVAAATYLLVVNVVGGLGPQIIGALSDHFTPMFGPSALAKAILSVSLFFSIWSASHFLLGVRSTSLDFYAAGTD